MPAIFARNPNEELLLQDLKLFLSKKTITPGTIEYAVVSLWLNDRLDKSALNRLYDTTLLTSKLNRILLKIAIVPQEIIVSLSKTYQCPSYPCKLYNLQHAFIETLKECEPFRLFLKVNKANAIKIIHAQMARVKDKGIAAEYSADTIACSYEEKWSYMNQFGPKEYELDLTSVSPIIFAQKPKLNKSPLSFLAELNLFSVSRSASVTPVNTPSVDEEVTGELPMFTGESVLFSAVKN